MNKERAQKALELRRQGFTLKQVGEILYVGMERARILIKNAEALEEIKNTQDSDSIDSLDFSTRTRNCLHAEGIKTISSLVTYNLSYLRKTPGMGVKSIEEIVQALPQYFKIEHDLATLGKVEKIRASKEQLKLLAIQIVKKHPQGFCPCCGSDCLDRVSALERVERMLTGANND